MLHTITLRMAPPDRFVRGERGPQTASMAAKSDGAGPAIDVALARRLVADQFPQWADLPVTPVEVDGWDNRTFRLGKELSVRLPTADWYALQVSKEQRWLPVLAHGLPLPIPQPVALAAPALGYPYARSVYRWLVGRPYREEEVYNLLVRNDDAA